MTLPPGTLSKYAARRQARKSIFYALAATVEADLEGYTYLVEIAEEIDATGREDGRDIVREEARRISDELYAKATASRRP